MRKNQVKFHFEKSDGSLSISFIDKNISFLQRLKFCFSYLLFPNKYKDFTIHPKDVDMLVKIVIKSKLIKQKQK